MSFVRSHGVDIYYERHGQGPAVLFCHGAGSNAATWWQQIPSFARHFTCLSYDHRCFGRSAAPPGAFMPSLFVDDALAVLDAEGIGKAALVCQSLGGITGLRLALQHPHRTWAFVPCDSPLSIDHPPLLANLRRFLGQAEATRLEDRAFAPAFSGAHRDKAFLYQQINGFNPAVYATYGSAMLQRLAALVSPEFLLPMHRLRHIACPTLFVVGEHDALVTLPIVADLAGHVAGSQVTAIAGAGHSAYFERPADFNDVVLDFLQQHATMAG